MTKMNKVYLLMRDDGVIYQGEIVGTFSSKEKALEYIKKNKYIKNTCELFEMEIDNPEYITYYEIGKDL